MSEIDGQHPRAALLIPIDRACLEFLIENGGSAPSVAVPNKLFAGEIPKGYPNLVDLGLIEHDGDIVRITSAGREAVAGTPLYDNRVA